MRSTPYPVPPSLSWTVSALATYGVLAIGGAKVLQVLLASPQPVAGGMVLGMWGGLTLPSALACLYGVARDRYRYEWMGCWGIVAGTSVYLGVTILGTLDSALALGTAAALLPAMVAGVVVGAVLFGYGLARSRAGFRRAGVWTIVTALVLWVVLAAVEGLGAAGPTILVFAYAIGRTLGRAIHLSLIDLAARRRVLTRTGEIAEVPPDV